MLFNMKYIYYSSWYTFTDTFLAVAAISESWTNISLLTQDNVGCSFIVLNTYVTCFFFLTEKIELVG